LETAVKVANNFREEEARKATLEYAEKKTLHDQVTHRTTKRTMSDVGRDRNNFDGSRVALKKLMKIGEVGASILYLFEPPIRLDWARRLMNRLVSMGAVDKVDSEYPGAHVVYVATSMLQEIVDSDDRLAAVIWPRSHAIPVVPEAPPENAEETVTQTEVEKEADGDGPQPTLEESVTAVLKISAATLENLVAIRERMASMESTLELVETRVSEIWEALK
jgi:hypothetical protein